METDAGAFDADVLVVALGADLDPAATPGLIEAGHEFYTVQGAFRTRDVLERLRAAGACIVGVTSTPFKCPPAPSETALLVHDHLLRPRVARRQRGRAGDAAAALPIPPSPAASGPCSTPSPSGGSPGTPDASCARSIRSGRWRVLADGGELPFDLFLGVPVHRVPAVVVESGMCVDGWIPVDPRTLETAYPGVYAVGDVTSVGTPKAGVFAEGQAAVVADAIMRAGGPASPSSTTTGAATATSSSATSRSPGST